MSRPARDEYDPYFGTYIDKVPDRPILPYLAEQAEDFPSYLATIPEAQETHRYAEGKWSIREVVGHVADVERAMGFRAFAFARRDPSPLPSFEQDDYVAHGGFEARSLADLADEFRLIRKGHLLLFEAFDSDTLARRGTASGMSFTVRSLLWILAGHLEHHRRILQSRYLGG